MPGKNNKNRKEQEQQRRIAIKHQEHQPKRSKSCITLEDIKNHPWLALFFCSLLLSSAALATTAALSKPSKTSSFSKEKTSSSPPPPPSNLEQLPKDLILTYPLSEMERVHCVARDIKFGGPTQFQLNKEKTTGYIVTAPKEINGIIALAQLYNCSHDIAACLETAASDQQSILLIDENGVQQSSSIKRANAEDCHPTTLAMHRAAFFNPYTQENLQRLPLLLPPN